MGPTPWLCSLWYCIVLYCKCVLLVSLNLEVNYLQVTSTVTMIESKNTHIKPCMGNIRGKSDIIGPDCLIQTSTVSYQHPLRPNGTFWPSTKHKHHSYTQTINRVILSPLCVCVKMCAHKGPLTNAEVRCCTSRAPVSASDPGERPSDAAGRSSWVAAADSSASQMHWSTPWSDAHMTSACHSTGCSVDTKYSIRDR